MVKPVNADKEISACGLSIETGIWFAAVFAFIESIIELRIVFSYWWIFVLLIIKAGLILNIFLTLKCNHAHSSGPVKSARAAFWIYLIVLIADTCLYIFVGSYSIATQKEEDEIPDSCKHVHDTEVTNDHIDLNPVWDGDAADEDHGPHEGEAGCETSFYDPKWVMGASIFLISLVIVKIYLASLLWRYQKFQAENEGKQDAGAAEMTSPNKPEA